MNLSRFMAARAVVGVTLLSCASCGGTGPPLYPVRGKVLVDVDEEGKVRLYRLMQHYFATEMPLGAEVRPPAPWWAGIVARIRSFFAGE